MINLANRSSNPQSEQRQDFKRNRNLRIANFGQRSISAMKRATGRDMDPHLGYAEVLKGGPSDSATNIRIDD